MYWYQIFGNGPVRDSAVCNIAMSTLLWFIDTDHHSCCAGLKPQWGSLSQHFVDKWTSSACKLAHSFLRTFLLHTLHLTSVNFVPQCMCIHTQIYTHNTHPHVHTPTCTHTPPTHTHTHTHAHKLQPPPHTHMHTNYTPTHTHIHTNTHTLFK